MNGRVTPDGKGFTIDKALAWTIGSAMIALAFWFGVQLSEIRGQLRANQDATNTLTGAWEAQSVDRMQYRREVDVRLRSLEQDRVGDRRDLANALNLLTRIDQRIERIEQRISP